MRHLTRAGTVISLLLMSVTASPVYAQLRDWDDPANSCIVDGVPTLKCLEIIYGNLLFVSSGLILLVLFAMLVYGSFTFLLSMGESAKVQKGQKIITWSLVGTIVFAGTYLILFIIDVAFMGGKGDIFRFKIPGPFD